MYKTLDYLNKRDLKTVIVQVLQDMNYYDWVKESEIDEILRDETNPNNVLVTSVLRIVSKNMKEGVWKDDRKIKPWDMRRLKSRFYKYAFYFKHDPFYYFDYLRKYGGFY